MRDPRCRPGQGRWSRVDRVDGPRLWSSPPRLRSSHEHGPSSPWQGRAAKRRPPEPMGLPRLRCCRRPSPCLPGQNLLASLGLILGDLASGEGLLEDLSSTGCGVSVARAGAPTTPDREGDHCGSPRSGPHREITQQPRPAWASHRTCASNALGCRSSPPPSRLPAGCTRTPRPSASSRLGLGRTGFRSSVVHPMLDPAADRRSCLTSR